MAASTRVPYLSVDDRRARGKEALNRTPLPTHTGWMPAAGRPDLVGLLEEQNLTREPDLVPAPTGCLLVSWLVVAVVVRLSRLWVPHSSIAQAPSDELVAADAAGSRLIPGRVPARRQAARRLEFAAR